MSIATEIQTLQANKAAIKAAIEAKNPAVAPTNVLSQWPDSIASISSGECPPVEKGVNFRDYDGALLYSYTQAETAELDALPELPTQPGLVCQGWNWTLAQVKAYVASYGKCEIGAIYTTDDGKTRIHITIRDSLLLNYPIRWSQTVANGVQVDFGDGSAVQTVAGTGAKALTHTYSPPSLPASYTITLNPASGNMSFGTLLLSDQADNQNSYMWGSTVTAVEFGNKVTSTSMTFRNVVGVRTVSMSNSVTSLGYYTFAHARSLQYFAMPSSVTSVSNNLCNGCRSLSHVSLVKSNNGNTNNMFPNSGLLSLVVPDSYTYVPSVSNSPITDVTIPDTVTTFGMGGNNNKMTSVRLPPNLTTINAYAFNPWPSLQRIDIPDSVTTIGARAFYDCSALAEINISRNSQLSTIGDGYAFASTSCPRLYIPKGVHNIPAATFMYCRATLLYDFSDHEVVPTLANTNAFGTTNANKKIVVPDALYEEWIASTNWNSTTNGIVTAITKASDYFVE